MGLPPKPGLTPQAKAELQNHLNQFRKSLLPHDNPNQSLSERLNNPQIKAFLENLDQPGNLQLPLPHAFTLKQLGMAAFSADDPLQAGIFYGLSFELAKHELDGIEWPKQAAAAAHSFLVVYEETKNKQVGRSAAQYFETAGHLQTAHYIYLELGDMDSADRIQSLISRHTRDSFERSGDVATSTHSSSRNSQNGQMSLNTRPSPQSPASEQINEELRHAFQVFGIQPNFPKNMIKSKFRELIHELHPANAGERYNEKRLIEVLKAKKVFERHGHI